MSNLFEIFCVFSIFTLGIVAIFLMINHHNELITNIEMCEEIGLLPYKNTELGYTCITSSYWNNQTNKIDYTTELYTEIINKKEC